MHRLSFIREIAATPENSIQWQTLTLAYRLLALIDLFAVETHETDTSVVTSFLDDVRSLAEDDPIVSRLAVIAALLHARRDRRGPAVTAAILELGELLQRRCLSALAFDVAVVALRLSAQDEALAWRSHRLCGWAIRSLGQFDEAAAHYAACIEIGQRLDCVEAVFWGRNGQCLLVQERGNLPRAEALFRRLMVWTQRNSRPDLEPHARHGLAITLGLRGQLRESLRHFEAALASSASIEWGRIVTNIGYTHLQLGELERARDLFLGLIATVHDVYETCIAHINLIDVYAAFGQRGEVERIRSNLESQSLLPAMTVDFQMTLGRAYLTLDDAASARPCFERAELLARRIGIGRAVIEADHELERLARAAPRRELQNSHSGLKPAFDTPERATASTRLARLLRP